MADPVGFGPFDVVRPVGLTEYGGGAGLVEGSPTSQSGKLPGSGGADHVGAGGAEMSVAEKIGIEYRTLPSPLGVGAGVLDPVTGMPPVPPG